MRSFLALLFVAVSMHAGVVAGPERPVAAPSFDAAYGINQVTTLATDGTDFLTVWTESTPGREGLYATIVNEAGETRPFAPQPLVRGSGAVADAVWTGEAYLLIGQANGVMMAMRLDREARLIAPPVPLEIQRPLSSLAWNGEVALAATYDPVLGTTEAMLLDAHGRLLLSVAHPAVNQSVAVAAGDAFLLVKKKFEGEFNGPVPVVTKLTAVRVTSDGTFSAPVEIATVNSYTTFDVAANGDRAGITAVLDAGVTQRALHRYTVDAKTLAVVSYPPVMLPDSLTGLDTMAAPGGFLAAWTYTTAGTPPGTLQTMLGSIGFDQSTAARAIAVPSSSIGDFSLESNGRTALAVWGAAPVRAMAFDAALTRNTTPLTPVATSAVRQSRPASASSPDAALLAWLDETSYNLGNIVVRRLDSAGNALDAQPRVVAGNVESDVTPAVAFTGKVWLVAWQAGRSLPEMRIYVRRLALDGTPLDVQPLDAGPGLYPALGANGKVAVLAMSVIKRNGMAAMRFNADGERIDATPFPVDDDRGYAPKLASNGRELLAVWEASPVKSGQPIGIVGVRFGEDGALLDPNPIEIALAPKNIDADVASNGTDFLVTYTNYLPSGYDNPNPLPVVYRAYAKRVLRTGVLADHTAQTHGYLLGRGRESQVARLGQTYAVTLARDVAAPPTEYTRYTLHAVRTDERGTALETQDVPNGDSYSHEHALTSHGNAVALVYPRNEPSLAHVQRLFLRTIVTEDATPGRRRAARK